MAFCFFFVEEGAKGGIELKTRQIVESGVTKVQSYALIEGERRMGMGMMVG